MILGCVCNSVSNEEPVALALSYSPLSIEALICSQGESCTSVFLPFADFYLFLKICSFTYVFERQN